MGCCPEGHHFISQNHVIVLTFSILFSTRSGVNMQSKYALNQIHILPQHEKAIKNISSCWRQVVTEQIALMVFNFCPCWAGPPCLPNYRGLQSLSGSLRFGLDDFFDQLEILENKNIFRQMSWHPTDRTRPHTPFFPPMIL